MHSSVIEKLHAVTSIKQDIYIYIIAKEYFFPTVVGAMEEQYVHAHQFHFLPSLTHSSTY
jgi:hypothetical protein